MLQTLGARTVVVLPPLIFHAWYDAAKFRGWTDDRENVMLSMYGSYMSAEQAEVAVANMLILRLHAFKHWLKVQRCQVRDVFPEICVPSVGNLTIEVSHLQSTSRNDEDTLPVLQPAGNQVEL